MAPRKEELKWIFTIKAHYGFFALTIVLAVNYFHRFILSQHLQRDKPWMSQLTYVACLSLAAKVEETHVPLLLDLQVCSTFLCTLPVCENVKLLFFIVLYNQCGFLYCV